MPGSLQTISSWQPSGHATPTSQVAGTTCSPKLQSNAYVHTGQSSVGIPLQNLSSSQQGAQYPAQSSVLSEDEKRCRAYKYHGYKTYSEWMASSNDFFIVRRFGALNAKVILMMQNDIVNLERELDALHKQKAEDPRDYESNDSLEEDRKHCRRRIEILRELKSLLKEYNEFVATFSDLKARRSAPDSQIRNAENFFETYPHAVCKEEREFLGEKGDLISIVPKSESPMQRLIGTARKIRLSWIFRAQPRKTHIKGPGTHFWSEPGLETGVTVIVILTGLALLFGPMWFLEFENGGVVRLAIITAFITVFALLLALAAGPRPFEVLAATAAYSAVLMVFLQVAPHLERSTTLFFSIRKYQTILTHSS